MPTPLELAAEAREALRQTPRQPGELFNRLVQLGWINAHGEVTKLLGGDADPELSPPPGNGRPLNGDL